MSDGSVSTLCKSSLALSLFFFCCQRVWEMPDKLVNFLASSTNDFHIDFIVPSKSRLVVVVVCLFYVIYIHCLSLGICIIPNLFLPSFIKMITFLVKLFWRYHDMSHELWVSNLIKYIYIYVKIVMCLA